MPQWEICRIKEVYRKQWWVLVTWTMVKYIAVLDTPGGEYAIDQTIELHHVAGEKQNHERAMLVGRLLTQGWEPIGTEYGLVTVLRRQVP
ncbi:MAG: hypothetical protein AB1817_19785 [Chloroflexota bacterium]